MAKPRSVPTESRSVTAEVELEDTSVRVGPEPRGIGYGVLRDEGKNEVLRQRAVQLEAEHYNHALNRKIFESQIETPGARAQIEQTKAAMVAIEAALKIIMVEVASMQPEVDAE